jgi:hypothetical protein
MWIVPIALGIGDWQQSSRLIMGLVFAAGLVIVFLAIWRFWSKDLFYVLAMLCGALLAAPGMCAAPLFLLFPRNMYDQLPDVPPLLIGFTLGFIVYIWAVARRVTTLPSLPYPLAPSEGPAPPRPQSPDGGDAP